MIVCLRELTRDILDIESDWIIHSQISWQIGMRVVLKEPGVKSDEDISGGVWIGSTPDLSNSKDSSEKKRR